MVIDDCNLFGIRSGPYEADPPLVIDTYGIPAGTATFECFEAIARR